MAIEISRTGYSPFAKRQAVVYTSWRAASIFVAISANLWRVDLEPADRAPERLALLRVRQRAVEHVLGGRHRPAAPIIRSPWSSHMMW